MLAVLIVVVAVMCLAVFGFEGDYLLHMVAADRRHWSCSG